MTLLDASDAVQDRKAASGISEFQDAVATGGMAWSSEHVGMLAGTNLTEDELHQLSVYFAQACVAMVAHGAPTVAAIAAIFREGVLTGIEHAKREHLT